MKTDVEQLLSEVFYCVLEKYAFMFGELSAKDQLFISDTEFTEVVIDFSGPRNGKISISVPTRVCPQIAVNVLGHSPEEDIENWGVDALKELLNVTCGSVLLAFYGEDLILDISPPISRPLSLQDWNALLNDPNTLAYLVDDSPMLLQFTLTASGE